MDDQVVYQVIKFNGNNPVLIIPHTNYSSGPIISHWHMDLEMNMLYEGKIDFFIDGQHEVLTENSVCLINSKAVHSCIPEIEKKREKIVGFTLIISYEFLQNMIPGYSELYWRVDKEEVQLSIAKMLRQILELYLNRKNEADDFKILGIVCEILSVLCEYCTYRRADIDINHQKNTERIRIILQYIHQNFQLPLNQKELAEKFYFSRGYFSSFFKRYTGKTFKEYLADVRILQAERMLAQTSNSISRIAMDCGFADERRFIETFKKYYNMTPGIYRKQEPKGMFTNDDKTVIDT